MDRVGRVVIPKPLREALGVVSGPADLEMTASDGSLEVTIADTPVRVEQRDGMSVIVPEQMPPTIGADEVRATIEAVRP
jgi:bifunctional DNA-binding transcriptional regulator/antitoxin component of YhaV-PrlF toxin-antitoxin module